MDLRNVRFRIGQVVVDPVMNRVSHGEESTRLEPRTMEVLVYLAGRPGELVSKQDLVDHVWQVEAVSENSLTRAVAEIRKALGDDAKDPAFIETIPKRGYRLVADVEIAATPTTLPPYLRSRDGEDLERESFVARGSELARLNGFLAEALAGRGGVAMISGQAGTGKTALLTEFARRATSAHVDLVVAPARCSAHTGRGDPFAPFRTVLGLLTGDLERARLTGAVSGEQAARLWSLAPGTIEEMATSASDLVDTLLPGDDLLDRARMAAPDAPWIADFEALVADRISMPSDPTLQQAAILGQYIGVVRSVVRSRPLLVIIDDLHWADSGSVGLLLELSRSMGGSRLLVVGAYRPEEVRVDRDGKPHPLTPVLDVLERGRGDTTIELRPSGDREFVEALIDSEPNRLDPAFRDELFRRTEGHALFTVELLRSLQERELIIRDPSDQWVESGELDWESVPSRVEDVIGERIDRLGGRLRELLTIASVEGSDFTAEVLARIRDHDTRRVVRLLSRELDRRHRLVLTRGLLELADNQLSLYGFAHILFQRYVYNDLGVGERRQLHREVGEVLESLYGDESGRIAGQLARHFDEAGEPERAIHYYRGAAESAFRMTANLEAIAHLKRAIELIQILPPSTDRDRLEAVTQLSLQAPLFGTQGWASDEAWAAAQGARDLTEKLGDEDLLVPVLFYTALNHTCRAEYRKADHPAARVLELVRSRGDDATEAMTHVINCFLRESTGDFDVALKHADAAIALYDPARHEAIRYQFGGVDAGVAARSRRSWVLAELGFLDSALETGTEAMEIAARIQHPFSTAFAQYFMARLRMYRGESEAAREQTEKLMELASTYGFPLQLLWGSVFLRIFDLESGTAADSEPVFDGYVDGIRAIGFTCASSYHLLWAGVEHHRLGRVDLALERFQEAESWVEERDELAWAPELYLRWGGVLEKEGHLGEAEAQFNRSLEYSTRQGSKYWELRAATALAKLWRDTGRLEEGRELLLPVVDWFTEGLDTAPLVEAKALLWDLSRAH